MRLSEEFHRLSVECADKEMNLRELVNFIGPRSRALISFVFSIPFLILIPLPGLSTVLGLFVAICGYSIAFRKGIWFPKFLIKKKITGKTLSNLFQRGEKILLKIEKVMRPRNALLVTNPIVQRINGFIIFICGLLLMLPLPPGTNFTPGLTVFLLSIGILEEDGLFVLLGYFAFLINLAFFILLPIWGFETLEAHK